LPLPRHRLKSLDDESQTDTMAVDDYEVGTMAAAAIVDDAIYDGAVTPPDDIARYPGRGLTVAAAVLSWMSKV